MSWNTSNRRNELPPDWRHRKHAVHQRDNWTCIDCGHHDPTGRTLECDHTANRHNHELHTLATRCHTCHTRRTQAQAAAARTQRSRQRPQHQPHPGLKPPGG